MDIVLAWTLVVAALVGLVATLGTLIRGDGLGHRQPPASEGHWASGTEWGGSGWPELPAHPTRPRLW